MSAEISVWTSLAAAVKEEDVWASLARDLGPLVPVLPVAAPGPARIGEARCGQCRRFCPICMPPASPPAGFGVLTADARGSEMDEGAVRRALRMLQDPADGGAPDVAEPSQRRPRRRTVPEQRQGAGGRPS